jgi:hypothetical protein
VTVRNGARRLEPKTGDSSPCARRGVDYDVYP